MADLAAPVVVVGRVSDSATRSPGNVVEAEVRPTLVYHDIATEWTKAMAKRFGELARKEALDSISAEELRELEGLTRDRRNLEHPRTLEEVLWEVNQRQVTANLVQALENYVEFHTPARPPRASADSTADTP